MKSFSKRLLVSLICALAFQLALTPATYAVDGCSSAGFKTASTLFLGAPPFAVAVADFNTDGHLDLVVAPNDSTTDVVVFYGRGGTEKFGPPTYFPAGGFPRRLASADFNGDGKPDLAVSLDGFGQTSSRLTILLNDGTGKFGAPSLIELQGEPLLPAIADLNNDGKLDMVVGLSTGTTDGRVSVLLGNGSGGFTQPANSPISTFSNNPSAVVIGDFNEDGKRDMALPGSVSGIDLRLGDGAGGFGPAVNTPTNISSFILIGGDFNKDGHLDLLSNNRMLLGSGTGTFSAPTVVDIPGDTNVAFTADVNHDTNLDVVTGGQNGLTIMLGNGAGGLVRGKSYASGFTTFGGASASGDFNEDGKTDLVGAHPLGLAVLTGDGAGAFNDALSYHTTVPNPRDLVAADFNNDGKQDFATIGPGFSGGFTNSAGVEVALGDGNGGFTKKSVTSFGSSVPSAITAGDFNNDGKLDLAVALSQLGRISILFNDGTGGFLAAGFDAPFHAVGFQPSTINAGDFNNDGKVDLISITRASNTFVVLLNDGTGNFNVFGGAPLQGTFSFFDDLAIADFNADGKSDLAVVRSAANVVHILHGNGGQFTSSTTLPTPGVPVSVVARDLNGDGKPDIAVTSSLTDTFNKQYFASVLINNGAGFNAATNYAIEAGGVLGTGDFNGDNHPDLAVSSGSFQVGSSPEGVAILTNSGTGTFNAAIYFPTGQHSDYLAVADFNNDSKEDVLVTQVFGNSVALLLNNFTTSPPCLSIDDVSITETDAGTINAVFTVKLSAASAQTVRVNYFTTPINFFANSAATRGVDFENVPGTVTFLPGETTKTINVPIKGDLIDEVDQFFVVSLTTPVNATITDGRALGTIVDNDSPPAISINDVSAAEGTQSIPQQSATFTVSLSAASEKPITVDVALSAGTATANTDYFNFAFKLEFPIGTLTRTVNVSLIPDTVFEPNETFFVNLSNPTDATIADAQGQGTITNDDPQPTISVVNAFRTEGASGTNGNALVDIKLSNPSSQTITVAFATANGTATAGTDYVATSGTVTFNPLETTKTISVQVNGDNLDELNETILINLTSPTNATIATPQGVATIVDDDGPTLSIGSASVAEGNTGLVNLVFTVTLSAPSPQDISVDYATNGGTATPGFDYQQVFPNTRSVFIPAGASSGTLSIRIFPDLQVEPDETVIVSLLGAFNATVAVAQGTGTIVNDDGPGKLKFSGATFSATEDAGSAVITVSRIDGATGSVSVDFATSNGTATAGSDYTATSGTLLFEQGETSKTFSIPIVNDNLLEVDETVNLTLSNPGGGATLPAPVTATLTLKSPLLILVLDESGPGSHQVAALDSVLLLRDPFPVLPTVEFFTQALDQNTRVILFVTNLQLAPTDTASAVTVNLFDSDGQSHNVLAEDLRVAPFSPFMQVTFRLPDNLRAGVCTVKVKAHDQESNAGTIRIK